ncbi:MAG: hypothetical protein CVU44_11420 [Chloroflexi bacterium HGW-Chloroflexi-6]|nr:MAG: hypothetical protein CVU44_11420 [Chloroflexi bacterium HGW-Chloroflexi-6]
MKNRFLLTLMVVLACLPAAQVVSAQTGIIIEQARATYKFGEQVTLRAELQTDQPVNQVQAFLRAQGESNTITIPASVDENGNIMANHAIANARLRPFAEVAFWFRITFADGTTADSPEFWFSYLDNRFTWQSLEENNLRVHWYAGDLAFGQSALDSARNGVERTSRLLSASLNHAVDIYIYANSNDLKATIEESGQAWVSGHASPDLYLALVSITPGPEEALNMDRKIPHELAHILTYEVSGERYLLLPIWLREGIATISEIYPSLDYPRSLEFAVENDGLLSFSNLCGDFPTDASSRFLAYAQAESFTRYLVDEYGISGLNRLIQTYGDGLGCEQGIQQALGVPLSTLEYAWRAKSLGENRLAMAFKNLSGYLIVFLVVLLLPLSPAIFSRKPKQPHEQAQSK